MTDTLQRQGRSGVVSASDLARAPRRIEGPDKVTGRVRFAADRGSRDVDGPLDHAVAIISRQASGRIVGIDAEAALASPGVCALISHENAPRLHKVTSFSGVEIADILPLQDDVIRYGGQVVALVVADTLENARAAAPLVHVNYSAPEDDRAFTLRQGAARAKPAKKIGGGSAGEVKIGDAEGAWKAAVHTVDEVFETEPHHHHNAIEPGAIVAAWGDDGTLTVQLPTQFSYGDAVALGQAFNFGLKDRLPRLVAQVLGGFVFDSKVRVISTMIGGGFGSKHGNTHLLLAPIAAKLTGRAVKLVLTRRQVFSMMPFRGETRQRLRLGADAMGRIDAIVDEALMSRGAGGSFVEPVVETITKSYAVANMHVTSSSARLDTAAPGWMRGPGASVGQFALESAVDMLAYRLGIDPLEFRLRNHADVEPDTGHEWSSKSLKACYAAAAEAIGWTHRDPAVGSMRQGRQLVGYGMATSLYQAVQFPSAARVILDDDGRGIVQTASHEIGQGTITAMSQIAGEGLGLPLEAITFEFGDTRLPFGGLTAASSTTLSNGSAIREAAAEVRQKLLHRAVKDPQSVFFKAKESHLHVVDGRIAHADGRAESVAQVMTRSKDGRLEAEAITGRDFGHSKYGRQTFGAQFVRVLVDPDLGHVTIDRLVGAFSAGRFINPLLARSQLIGGMVWGIGQAMMEATAIDSRTGMWMNCTLGEALVPTNADVPDIEAILIEEDDTRGHPLGVKGLGEIGNAPRSPQSAMRFFMPLAFG